MCFAAAGPIVSAGMSIATAAAGFSSQQQQYAQELTAFNQNYEDALSDNRADETNLTEQQIQTQQQHGEADYTSLLELAQKQSMVRAAAATGGEGGISVTDVANGVGRDIAEKRANLDMNWKGAAQQLQSQKDSSVTQEMARIGQVANPIEPDPTGAILGAAGGIFKGAGDATKAGLFGTPTGSSQLTGAAAPAMNPIAAASPAVNSFGIGIM